jgi:ATP phosphoribosyltransferase regulatory subunit
MRWVLPEYIQDALPDEARKVEGLRRALLDAFAVRGYQLVQPPLLEYLDGLLTGAGQDLELRTFKLVDQLSGRSMGVRADMTPQVARIDAHLLNRRGVSRLCYCGSVLHSLPASLVATREPLQLGAEIYGHAGLEADVEIIRLLAESLALTRLPATRIDLGHVGLFRALVAMAGLEAEQEQTLFALLQAKDVPSIAELLAGTGGPASDGLLALSALYGEPGEVLARARAALPDAAPVRAALDELECLAGELADLPLSFDLADLRGYHYHSGAVFAAYGGSSPAALALGGRYDQVGLAFGRGRPATGFSLDLRQLALELPDLPARGGVLAPCGREAGLADAIDALRAAGEVVMIGLPGHGGSWREAGCDRQLVLQHGVWIVAPLLGD